ncbi:MAG: hypothetical protein ACO3JG_14890 [Luteolibacter sp.]
MAAAETTNASSAIEAFGTAVSLASARLVLAMAKHATIPLGGEAKLFPEHLGGLRLGNGFFSKGGNFIVLWAKLNTSSYSGIGSQRNSICLAACQTPGRLAGGYQSLKNRSHRSISDRLEELIINELGIPAKRPVPNPMDASANSGKRRLILQLLHYSEAGRSIRWNCDGFSA